MRKHDVIYKRYSKFLPCSESKLNCFIGFLLVFYMQWFFRMDCIFADCVMTAEPSEAYTWNTRRTRLFVIYCGHFFFDWFSLYFTLIIAPMYIHIHIYKYIVLRICGTHWLNVNGIFFHLRICVVHFVGCAVCKRMCKTHLHLCVWMHERFC